MKTLARLADESAARVVPATAAHGEQATDEPKALRQALFPAPRPGAFGLLRDLQALKVFATEMQVANNVVSQAARGLRDAEMMAACGEVEERNRLQAAWLQTQILHRAAHTLIVPQ
jgi:hypothetical protein